MRKIAPLAVAAALALSGVALADGPADDTSPARSCKDQRAAIGAAAFRDLYGTNRTKRNAFGKCVARLARTHESAEEHAADTAPAACRAERDRDPAAFAERYGTNRRGTNAFGKCVSATAKAKGDEAIAEHDEATISAAKACKAERARDPAAFAERYGTNRNNRNAFGKCVAQHAKDHDDA
jgi:hypothetical protein